MAVIGTGLALAVAVAPALLRWLDRTRARKAREERDRALENVEQGIGRRDTRGVSDALDRLLEDEKP